jgi:hypothetical protein
MQSQIKRIEGEKKELEEELFIAKGREDGGWMEGVYGKIENIRAIMEDMRTGREVSVERLTGQVEVGEGTVKIVHINKALT